MSEIPSDEALPISTSTCGLVGGAVVVRRLERLRGADSEGEEEERLRLALDRRPDGCMIGGLRCRSVYVVALYRGGEVVVMVEL